jgi:hypothetical protein
MNKRLTKDKIEQNLKNFRITKSFKSEQRKSNMVDQDIYLDRKVEYLEQVIINFNDMRNPSISTN